MNNKINIVWVLLFGAYNIFAQAPEPSEDSALVKVFFTDFENQPRQGEKVIFTGEYSKVKFIGITNEAGTFSILLPEGDIYNVKYINVTEEVDYSNVEIKKEAGSYTYNIDLKFEPPKTYTLKNVYFDVGNASIRKESFSELDNLAELMSLKPNMVIEIAGHTDSKGSNETNLTLSQERAEAVKQFLVAKGITAERIKAVGYGDSQPIADNSTEEGRQKNRRTEVRIIQE